MLHVLRDREAAALFWDIISFNHDMSGGDKATWLRNNLSCNRSSQYSLELIVLLHLP